MLPVFALLGLMLPWREWAALGWKGTLPALSVLLLRPLLSPLHRVRDALLIGWFGPIGVGSLFYATLARRETGGELPWTVGSLLVVASVVAHGLSATPLTRAQERAAARPET